MFLIAFSMDDKKKRAKYSLLSSVKIPGSDAILAEIYYIIAPWFLDCLSLNRSTYGVKTLESMSALIFHIYEKIKEIDNAETTSWGLLL